MANRAPARPTRTHFDFRLAFPDGVEVIIEREGPQHFCVHRAYYSDDGCGRDVGKEEWAIARSLCVVRVLQKDILERSIRVAESVHRDRTVGRATGVHTQCS